jgi:hypothetical protein
LAKKKKTKTDVVNLKSDPYDIDITRRGIYGNPYIIGEDGTREEVVEKYKGYLDRRLAHQPDFLLPLKNKRLGCVCKPLLCHGDVIVSRLDL